MAFVAKIVMYVVRNVWVNFVLGCKWFHYILLAVFVRFLFYMPLYALFVPTSVHKGSLTCQLIFSLSRKLSQNSIMKAAHNGGLFDVVANRRWVR